MQGTVEVEIISRDTAVVVLAGEHDLATSEHVAVALAAAGVCPTVVVDVDPCTFADTSVISSVMFAARKQSAGGGHLLVVAQPERPVRRVLELMGIDAHVPIHETRSAAFATVTPGRPRMIGVSERIDRIHLRRSA
jgi:stage II sporulation protein AA (anti-sigma F factor antagonist)